MQLHHPHRLDGGQRSNPLFAEAKGWHGIRRFRLRRLKKVNIEALRIAPGENIKRLLDFGGLRQKTLGHRQQPYTRRAHLLRSGALGSIVRTALGGQRRHFSTR
jgi:hypothetical protein